MSGVLGGLIAAFPTPVTTSYASIATTTVSTAVSSVTFSGIPATYTHLQLRLFWKLAAGTNLIANYNGSGAGNYKTHIYYTDGATISSGVSSVSPDAVGLGYAGASTFAITIVDILDYTNTNKYKTTRYLMGNERNTVGDIEFGSALWLDTSAINQIVVAGQGGSNLQQYSSLALYGIKG